ncbi:hypothetical protein [Streptomyces sp. NBC_01465]|uniref:hypothetical protein n=1 Tax=Streptomyces sp. NBC_01465 TaxID=2903878 RepID=UPI002E36FBD8|nr:hypothetical protein [Streptomyces sp. NBC_01465]
MGGWRKALLALGVMAVIVTLVLVVGDRSDDEPGKGKSEQAAPFTVAVVTDHATEDRAAAARVALDELRRLLVDNKSPGRLPLEFVAVRPRDGLTVGALRKSYPRLVAVVADDPVDDDTGSSVPVVGTCRPDAPTGFGDDFTTTIAPPVAEVGWQLRTYLAKKQRTKKLLVFGSWGTDAGITDELGKRGADPGWRGPDLPSMTVEIHRPGDMTAGELRSALSKGTGDARTAVHLSGRFSRLSADLRALGRAGYRGTVLYAPGVESPCWDVESEAPGPVPDGITLYRVDTVAPGSVLAKDCQKGNTERCPWLVQLPDRLGALEEYEAAQAIVRMYRTVWYEGKGEVPDDPDELAEGLAKGINEQLVRSLGGWFDPSGEAEDHTFGFGHDIWLHRWSERAGGRWERLGPLSALYW